MMSLPHHGDEGHLGALHGGDQALVEHWKRGLLNAATSAANVQALVVRSPGLHRSIGDQDAGRYPR